MDGYRLILASDVLERDGLGLELYSPQGIRLAEVFRNDDSGAQLFTSFNALLIDPRVLTWFLEQAANRLA